MLLVKFAAAAGMGLYVNGTAYVPSLMYV